MARRNRGTMKCIHIYIFFSSSGENICLFVRSDTKVQIPWWRQCKSQPGGDFPKLFGENSVSGLSTRRSVAASTHCIDGKQPSILPSPRLRPGSFSPSAVNRTRAEAPADAAIATSPPVLLLFLPRFLAGGCLAIGKKSRPW